MEGQWSWKGNDGNCQNGHDLSDLTGVMEQLHGKED